MSALRHWCLLEVSVDYNQFYIWDPDASDRNALQDWTDADTANRAKAGRSVVVLCPARNAEVPVEFGIWDSEPQAVFNLWQHVIEAPLSVQHRIEVHECTTGVPKALFTVEPGDYTVRGLFRGLDTVSADGDSGKDFYEVQIWKASCKALRVVRQWQ